MYVDFFSLVKYKLLRRQVLVVRKCRIKIYLKKDQTTIHKNEKKVPVLLSFFTWLTPRAIMIITVITGVIIIRFFWCFVDKVERWFFPFLNLSKT